MKTAWKYCFALVLSGFMIFGIISPVRAAEKGKATGHVEFRVGTTESKRVAGARIIVVNPEGKIVASGLTNSSGVWNASVPYQNDPKYEQAGPRGTVTAIVVANGYNEQAVFEVPIKQDAVQPVVLYPISKNQRNEPTASLGNIHHHDLISFIDHFANKFGLKRQAPIPNEKGYAPWGPEVSNSSNSTQRGITK